MRSFSRTVSTALLMAVLGSGLAAAQSFDFNLLLTPPTGSPATIPNNQTIDLPTAVNTQTQVSITATYVGSTAATITAAPSTWLLGSTEFSVALVSTTTGSTTLPLMLGPGQSFTFTVTYAPKSASAVSAQVTIPYTEPGSNGTMVQNAIILLFNGSSPVYSLFYVLQVGSSSGGNAVLIPPGGTIPFPPTQINNIANADLNIYNTGSGAGAIASITQPPASSPFKVFGIPPLGPGVEYSLASGAFLQLLVQYTPTAAETDTAQITITYEDGSTATVNLMGSGITSAFTYKYLVNGVATTVMPGGTIMFQGANVGSTSSLIVQVTNTGSATGTINSVSTSPPFSLTNPIVLPATLTTGNSFSVPLTFTPTQVGTQTGQLVIGNDFFTLSGQGLGSNLTYAYTSDAGTFQVNPTMGGTVVFGSVPIGQSQHITFNVTNSGSQAATISLIGTSPSPGPFTVSSPALSLQPSQSAQFVITFMPTAIGLASGTLVLNTTMIPLTGYGTAPPNLPSYTISGPSGNVSPVTQSNVSLTLANSYPVDLTGVLTLTTSGNFGTDPNVQFASGGRTVDFTIPANTTSADFAGQGSQLPIQTGTVAETVTLTPSFATTGGVNVTPSSPPTLQFTVPSLAPVIESIQVTNATTSSFDIVVIGYSTTRSLTSLNVTFTPSKGYSLSTTQFAIDVSQVASVWFQSTSSQAFGGQFQITETFNLPGTPPKNQTLIQAIASVSATVGNSVGTSNSLAANVE